MRREGILALVGAVALAATAVIAQVTSGPGMTLTDVQAILPQPSSSVPPAETIGGAIGTPGTYQSFGAAIPRITRAGTCTLGAGGTCSVTWATALSASPNVLLQPINTVGAQPISCNPTATPTTTGVSVKCWVDQTTTLSLAIVTTGLNLAPATTAPAGTVVQVTALPPTQ